MNYRRKLYFYKDIYDYQGTNQLFLNAVKENITYHRKHNKKYQAILKKKNFRVGDLSTYQDLYKIPFLPTIYFKKHKIASMKDYKMLVKATSSGTTGKRSEIEFDLNSLLYAGIMAMRMCKYHKLLSKKRTNYIVLGYEPHKSNQTVITKTQFVSTLFAPPMNRKYAIKYRNGGYEVDFKGIKKALDRYLKMNYPVRIVGFPSYTLFLLQWLKSEGLSYQLPKDSMLMLGGGWKGFYKEKVEKEELYQLANEVFGIEGHNCREFFGAVEHPSLYCSCKNNHFHVPIFSRVIIRDVDTLKPVTNGKVGLINLITPLAKSMPLVSIMTDDLGILRDGKECGCGIKSPYFEILGRVGVKEIKTCAAGASELL